MLNKKKEDYSEKMSRHNPGLIVILLDQSYSMTDVYIGNESKAVFATKAVNNVINEIVILNSDGEKMNDRCSIFIFGYGEEKELLLKGTLEELERSPIRVEKIKKKVSDGAGGVIEQNVSFPVWVETMDPDKSGGTPMHIAFKNAYNVISQWLKQKSDTLVPAPILINISDGMPNSESSARKEAEKVLDLKSEDGNVLIYNAHIGVSKKGNSDLYLPADKKELDIINNPYEKKNAKFLFDISSKIPKAREESAKNSGLNMKENSRGFVFNASAEILVKLLIFGTDRDRLS